MVKAIGAHTNFCQLPAARFRGDFRNKHSKGNMAEAANNMGALWSKARNLAGLGSDRETLHARMARGSSWIIINYGSEIVFRFATSVIVTRLLDPAAYGLMGIVSVFIVVSALIADLGFRPIVQTHKRGDEPAFVNTIWVMQILRGFILSVLMGLIALAWYWGQQSGSIAPSGSYGQPVLPALLAVMALTFSATGFNSINEFRLARHLQQGAVSRVEIAVRVINMVMTIGLAFWLRSVWALAITALAMSAIRAIATLWYLPGPRPAFVLDREVFWEVLSRSRWIALTSALSVMVTSADKLIISYVFDVTVLGIFIIAATLFDAAQALISRYHSTLGIAFMREAGAQQKGAALEADTVRRFYNFRLPADLYCVAGAIGFVFLGPWVVDLLYDPRYAMAGTYLSLLGVGFALFPLRLATNIPLAQERFKYYALATLVRALCFYAGMALAGYYQSMTAMVLIISLQMMPEYLFVLFFGKSGIPFSIKRDGPLLLLAAALLLWCLYR
jgi:O-antigen/teichoic acid export membrane protein